MRRMPKHRDYLSFARRFMVNGQRVRDALKPGGLAVGAASLGQAAGCYDNPLQVFRVRISERFAVSTNKIQEQGSEAGSCSLAHSWAGMDLADLGDEPMNRRIFILLTAFLTLGLVLAAWNAERVSRLQMESRARAEAQAELNRVRDRMQAMLSSDIQLVRGLIAVIQLQPALDQSLFPRVAAPLFTESTNLRNIALAPDLVIRYVVPLEGNEKAIGTDYRELPAQWPSVERARDTRQIVVAGPLTLVQGGNGLAVRMPVFFPRLKGEERFWGIISAVIDVDRLFAASGLQEENLQVQIAIRGRDATGPEGEVFFGNGEVFDDKPVLAEISLPHGSWLMAATPKGGWSTKSSDAWSLRIGYLLIAALVLGTFSVLARSTVQVTAARERAEASRRQLSATLENTPNVAVQWFDQAGRVSYWNAASERIFGWSETEARGRALDELLLEPEDYATFREAIRLAGLRDQPVGPCEYAVRDRDNARRWVESTIFAIPDEAGNSGHVFVCMDVDISARKLAEERVAEFNRDFETFLDQTTDFVYFKDAERRFRFCSQTLADLTGHTSWRDMIGKHDREVFPPDTAKVYIEEE